MPITRNKRKKQTRKTRGRKNGGSSTGGVDPAAGAEGVEGVEEEAVSAPPPSKYPDCYREFQLTNNIGELLNVITILLLRPPHNRGNNHTILEEILKRPNILNFINHKLPGTSYTFLHQAFLYGEFESVSGLDILGVVKKLINAGADPNMKDGETGDTPLHLAVKNLRNREHIIQYINFLNSERH